MNIASQNRSGVYQIPCIPGCDKYYYGRTLKPLYLRLREHRKDLDKNVEHRGHVEHRKSHPGHKFDLTAARVIWRSNNEYECKFVESACIKSLSNCNIRSEEVYLSPPVASMVSNIVVKHNSNRNNKVPQRTPLYVSPLMSDNTSLLSIAAADITISGTSSSHLEVVSTPQTPLPLPSAPGLSQLTTSLVSSFPDTFSYVSPASSDIPMTYPSATISSSPKSSDLTTSPDMFPDSSHPSLAPRLSVQTPLPQRTFSRITRRNLASDSRYSSQNIQHLNTSTSAGNLAPQSSQLNMAHITKDVSVSCSSPMINRLRSSKLRQQP